MGFKCSQALVDSINAESGIFESVTLTSGEKIVGDMLITGIGVFPDSSLAARAGIETQRKMAELFS